MSTIVNRVIPLIDYMRREIPLRFETMFEPGLRRAYNVGRCIDCGNLRESDIFFEAVKQR